MHCFASPRICLVQHRTNRSKRKTENSCTLHIGAETAIAIAIIFPLNARLFTNTTVFIMNSAKCLWHFQCVCLFLLLSVFLSLYTNGNNNKYSTTTNTKKTQRAFCLLHLECSSLLSFPIYPRFSFIFSVKRVEPFFFVVYFTQSLFV